MPLSHEKARKILHDKEVRGKALTEKQRRFFGAVASKQRIKKRSISEALE